ncbi:MAG: transposase [Bacillaceae bacterium]|nr:transposase [Bacillaceae bacterium]
MDHIWREFQGYANQDGNKRKKVKIFSDFWGKSSLFFMKHYPHPSYILELGEVGLRKLSKEHNLKLRQNTIDKLLYVANQALSRSLQELKDLERLNENIQSLEKEIETLLLQTYSKLLLTVPGIGVTLDAELYSEIGDISQYENPGQIIKKRYQSDYETIWRRARLLWAHFQTRESSITICHLQYRTLPIYAQ